MTTEETTARYLDRAATYVARGEKCLLQVRQKLKEWSQDELTPAQIASILNTLQEHGLVNEERYAQAYVSDKRNFSNKGPYLIKQELLERGLPTRIVEEALGEVSEQAWLEALQRHLQSKAASLHGKSPYEVRDKLFRAGKSKGYSTPMVLKVIRQQELPTDGLEE